MVQPYMVHTIHLYTHGHILARRESCQGCPHELNAYIQGSQMLALFLITCNPLPHKKKKNKGVTRVDFGITSRLSASGRSVKML